MTKVTLHHENRIISFVPMILLDDTVWRWTVLDFEGKPVRSQMAPNLRSAVVAAIRAHDKYMDEIDD